MDGKKALIGMSGGVDSSVAALLMLRAGYECIGATMRLYDNDMIGLEKGHTCCSLDDVEDARSVARRLGIPHYVFNFKDDFELLRMRRHSQPLHRLQPVSEIRPAPPPRSGAGVRLRGIRALRASKEVRRPIPII